MSTNGQPLCDVEDRQIKFTRLYACFRYMTTFSIYARYNTYQVYTNPVTYNMYNALWPPVCSQQQRLFLYTEQTGSAL